jgi:hypothetical protein
MTLMFTPKTGWESGRRRGSAEAESAQTPTCLAAALGPRVSWLEVPGPVNTPVARIARPATLGMKQSVTLQRTRCPSCAKAAGGPTKNRPSKARARGGARSGTMCGFTQLSC